MYNELERGHPDNFGNLIYLFKDRKSENLYADTCHYTPTGSDYVAEAIIKGLIRLGVLHKE